MSNNGNGKGLKEEQSCKMKEVYNKTPFASSKNRCFEGNYRLHHQGEKFSELVTALAITCNSYRIASITRVKTIGAIVTASTIIN
jgi:hypothetical protein